MCIFHSFIQNDYRFFSKILDKYYLVLNTGYIKSLNIPNCFHLCFLSHNLIGMQHWKQLNNKSKIITSYSWPSLFKGGGNCPLKDIYAFKIVFSYQTKSFKKFKAWSFKKFCYTKKFSLSLERFSFRFSILKLSKSFLIQLVKYVLRNSCSGTVLVLTFQCFVKLLRRN